MKKKLQLTGLGLITIATLAACGNRTFIDTTYTYTYAQVQLPDGTIKAGPVTNWRDYTDGDQLQITFEDGTTILTHATNAILSTTELKN